MRHEETILAGFGGQGVLFAGQLLSYAGMSEGLHVTWIPSYGPEMRGGTANCTVIVSEEEIGAPVVRNPTAAIVFNGPSMAKYEPLVKPGGVLLVNASLIETKTHRTDLRAVYVPASYLAAELGNVRMANMILLGAFVELTGLVAIETVMAQLDEHLPQRRREWLEPNYTALAKGVALVQNVA